jgi:hypothetical protein
VDDYGSEYLSGGLPPGDVPDDVRYRIFAEAVLALHRRLEFPALDRVMCSCGLARSECPVAGLAERIFGTESPR